MLIVAVVIYLSFFRPPSLEISRLPAFDKAAHFCMYAGLSGMLWLEYFRNHRLKRVVWHGWVGAVVCPILLSGLIELAQEYCTDYRGGEWLDFLANVAGVGVSTLFAWYVLRPLMTH